jgi:hypothetical protein
LPPPPPPWLISCAAWWWWDGGNDWFDEMEPDRPDGWVHEEITEEHEGCLEDALNCACEVAPATSSPPHIEFDDDAKVVDFMDILIVLSDIRE